MDISVILCTWNNAARLTQTMEAIAACIVDQSLSWELVLVNNNSTDETEAIVRSFTDRLPIKYVFEEKQGLSYARNAGLANACGKLVVFTDDDVIPCADWLATYWSAYQERPEGYYFGGPVVSQFEGEVPGEELLDHAPWSVKGLDHGSVDRELTGSELFLAANWACPARYLDSVGRFNVDLGLNADNKKAQASEEKDLMQRLNREGLVGWYLHRAELHHVVPEGKTSLEHIASRKEAAVYSSFFTSSDNVRRFSLASHPLGLYRDWLRQLCKWATRYVLGRSWVGDYIRWRKLSGKIRGFRDHYRSGR